MSDENKTLMRQIIKMFCTGDLFDADSAIAVDYVDHQEMPGLDTTGLEGFSRVLMTARNDYPDLQVRIEDLIAEGDRVVVRLLWQGTHQSGKKISRETIDIVRFANGHAVEHRGV